MSFIRRQYRLADQLCQAYNWLLLPVFVAVVYRPMLLFFYVSICGSEVNISL